MSASHACKSTYMAVSSKLTANTLPQLDTYMYIELYVCTYVINTGVMGGRWKNGSGGGSGEDMELLFSYLSRWGFVTKNMLSYRKCRVHCDYTNVTGFHKSWLRHTHTCTHTHIHTHVCTLGNDVQAFIYIHRYIHTCMHAYIHTYIHTCIHLVTNEKNANAALSCNITLCCNRKRGIFD